MSSYTCPKCHSGTLVKDGKTPGGRQRWSHYLSGGGSKVFCYTTTAPGSGAVINARGDRTKAGKPLKFKRAISPDTKVFIITAAQNATPVHDAFWQCLLFMKENISAELMVIPLRYKNATSQWTASQQNAEWWDKKVTPYLYNARKALNTNLDVLADIKTQPTASSPLTGFEAISHGESCIIGHTKLQMKVVPTPSHKFPKIITTTGACTKVNYTDSKAGKLGEFHHSLSAVIVEVAGEKTFHLRHVHFDNKTSTVTDLDTTYDLTGAWEAERPLALIMGDTHVDFIDPGVERATFGKDGIIETLNPERLVWHDLLDAYAVNPHHRGNPFNALAKHKSGRDDVKAEVERAVEFVNSKTPAKTQSYIVPSNHDNFLSRWVSAHDWRTDSVNAEFYLQTALEMVRQTSMQKSGTSTVNPFAHWVREWGGANVTCLKMDEALTLGGVELGMHGDMGPNGAKGSIRNLRRIGMRSVVGHSHSPGIDEGCYQVGTSTHLRLEYNPGPSGWLNTHCVLHADGKRQLINIINGSWRL